MQLGFEVYLCSQNEPLGFAKLTEDLANYQILDQLTKFNTKGGYQQLAENFKLARDKIKVLNPIDLYEVRTSFTQLVQDHEGLFDSDDLKVIYKDSFSYFTKILVKLFFQTYADIDELYSHFFSLNDSLNEKLDIFLNNYQLGDLDTLEFLISSFKGSGGNTDEIDFVTSMLVLDAVSKKINKFCLRARSRVMSNESITPQDVSSIFPKLHDYNLSRFKQFLNDCFESNKFLEHSLDAVFTELPSNISLTFFECLIKYYPNVSDLPKIFFNSIDSNNLEILNTVNYEYAKNFWKVKKMINIQYI